VVWIYHQHRQTAHRGVLSPEQAKWIAYCSTDLPGFGQLVEEGDERLFKRINNNSSHVLRELLPPPSMATQQYNLRRRPHDRQMPDHSGHLADKNFLTRMLFKDSVVIVYFQVSAYAFCHVLIKK